MPKLKKKKRKKYKKMKGRGKGAQFEREFCRDLSLWWSHKKRDDLFWRSSQSGGRATRRKKKNLQTAGSHGDVTALHSDGMGLLLYTTIELKRGYNGVTSQDLLDNQSMMLDWITKAEESATSAHTEYWWIIHRRSKRDAILIAPSAFWHEMPNFPVDALEVKTLDIVVCKVKGFGGLWDLDPEFIKEKVYKPGL